MRITVHTLQDVLAQLSDDVAVLRVDAPASTTWLRVGRVPVVVRVAGVGVWAVGGVDRPPLSALGREGAWLRWWSPYHEVAAPRTVADLAAIVEVVARRAAAAAVDATRTPA